MTEAFTATKRNRDKLKSTDVSTRLNEYRTIIKESSMFRDLTTQLQLITGSIKAIRCLAIGSFTDDFPARYQLAMLLEIVSYLTSTSDTAEVLVSIYDPVFTNEDKEFIGNLGPTWSIDKNLPLENFGSESTLFFLPHAPLNLTEYVLINEKPTYFLANNIIQHTDRYTASQLNQKYPITSKLVYIIQNTEQVARKGDNQEQKKDDGFTTFVSKRNRKNKKNKYLFKEPSINYSEINTYFKESRVLTDFDKGEFLKDKPWVNSFSDLTFHIIT